MIRALQVPVQGDRVDSPVLRRLYMRPPTGADAGSITAAVLQMKRLPVGSASDQVTDVGGTEASGAGAYQTFL
jgi:hypothetical protein